MKRDTDILITGGGLNGCTLAIGLSQTGHRVTLVDQLPLATHANPKFDGRGYSLNHATMRMLMALDLWGGIEPNSQPILDIVVTHGKAEEGASPYYVHFDHHEIEEGPMGYMVEDRYLRKALHSKIKTDRNINYISGDAVIDHNVLDGAVSVTLASGKILLSNLIIGCDGRNSSTAQRADIKRTGWEYDQVSLVCAVEHEKPHNNIAYQFFMPAGPLAILPLPGNSSSIVWTEGKERGADIHALKPKEYLQALKPCFGDFLGQIKLVGNKYTYPLGLSLAHSFIADRVALVGDAAHGIHPLAGQGLNLGLRDVAALIEVLSDAKKRGEDIGTRSVLQRYQTWRRFDTTMLSATTDGLNKVFSSDNEALTLIKNLGMATISAFPSLRRNMIREAAGLSGDLPKLMQGRKV